MLSKKCKAINREKIMKKLLLSTAIVLTANAVFAKTTDVIVGLQLEPPHLDPTSAAAGAIVSS